VPKIPRLDPGFAELIERVGGSLARLREIVDAHERQAEGNERQAGATETSGGTSGGTAGDQKAPGGIQLNPLPPPEPEGSEGASED
jgi:hypothetical protein